MQFLANHEAVTTLHQQLAELSHILQTTMEQPEQDFFDLREDIHRLRIEGTYLEEQTLWELLRTLRTLHAWVKSSEKTQTPTPKTAAMQIPSTTIPKPGK